MSASAPLRETILHEIVRNRISSVEVADALNKTGVQEGFSALNSGHFQAGVVHYISTWGESNWPLHEQIQRVEEGDLVYIDAIDCGNRAVLGDIVAKYLFVYKRIGGLVINGLVRDAHRLIKEDYPIWCKGSTPLGCFNRDVEKDEAVAARIAERQAAMEGSILVCDDSGCTRISADRHTDQTLSRLSFIEFQEDIWYFCIDTLKWSTYETICLKRYLSEPEILPEYMQRKLRAFDLQ